MFGKKKTLTLTEIADKVAEIVEANGIIGSIHTTVSHKRNRGLEYNSINSEYDKQEIVINVCIFNGINIVKHIYEAPNPETVYSQLREFFIGYQGKKEPVEDIIL